MLPVKTGGSVELRSADSSKILEIETDSPQFKSFSPDHNAASQNDPDFVVQITDDASGVSKSSVRLLFEIERTGSATGHDL